MAKAKKTFTEVQKEVMDIARRNDLRDDQAESLLRRRLRQENIPLPEYMSKKQEFKKGGVTKKTGPMKMAHGGMAHGKPHMYLSNGGAVVDNLPNPGLKALAKTAKGKTAVRKMGFDV